ncbi:hypothetical protein Angca_009273 [Angiostrongylus cantonensis]|nr:hypothetical protein Angca_009273 [Angiostrongylus cantonensis]
MLINAVFIVWMQHRGTRHRTSKGLDIYDAIDTTNCESVISYGENFWISSIGIGNYTHTNASDLIPDTGTTFTLGENAIVDMLARAGGAVYNGSQHLYVVECNVTPPTLDITFEAYKYFVQSASYVIEASGCKQILFGYSWNGFLWFGLLGTPFTRQFCTIFHIGQRRMGFAASLQK